MPFRPQHKMGRGSWHSLPATCAALILVSGCIGGPQAARLGAGQGLGPTDPPQPGSFTEQGVVSSGLIDSLRNRQSVIAGNGPFTAVADSVIAASAGAAVAELRVARLRAEARSKNWLPSIGPVVNLTSLGSVLASMVLEQTIFDNGRKKAERDFAAADVEVAAVVLAQDMNDRVYEGLSYYIEGALAREQSVVAAAAVERLREYDRIVGVRVSGGLSDRSEAQIIRQKFTEMQSTLASDQAAVNTALASLNAISATPVTDARGLQAVGSDPGAEPLSVLMARGDGARTIAEAKIARAGLLPGVSARATLDDDGDVDSGLRLGTDGLIGLGLGSDLAALGAAEDVSDRRIAEAAEDARRDIVTLEQQIVSLQIRERDGAQVLLQTKINLDLFTEQYQVGRRTLLELVSQDESYARLARDHAALKYEIALRQLQIARVRGQLVDGARL
jgi:outer membrane protein, adhesin transport system